VRPASDITSAKNPLIYLLEPGGGIRRITNEQALRKLSRIAH